MIKLSILLIGFPARSLRLLCRLVDPLSILLIGFWSNVIFTQDGDLMVTFNSSYWIPCPQLQKCHAPMPPLSILLIGFYAYQYWVRHLDCLWLVLSILLIGFIERGSKCRSRLSSVSILSILLIGFTVFQDVIRLFHLNVFQFFLLDSWDASQVGRKLVLIIFQFFLLDSSNR